MTAGIKVKANRTTGSGPPPNLLFGEIAYSDADQQLYVGRPAPAAPTVFKGNTTDYGPAIATLSTGLATLTTSDAAQDTAIAALILNDTAQDSALSALQAQPVTYGFTYDQQAEPSAPAAGATWRERSAGGLIVGEWEWSGSLWMSTTNFHVQRGRGTTNIVGPTSTTGQSAANIVLVAFCRPVIITEVVYRHTPHPVNAANTLRLRLLGQNDSGNLSGENTPGVFMGNNTFFSREFPWMATNNSIEFRFDWTIAGTIQNFFLSTVGLTFKRIR